MQATEFETQICNGIVNLPSMYHHWNERQVSLIPALRRGDIQLDNSSKFCTSNSTINPIILFLFYFKITQL